MVQKSSKSQKTEELISCCDSLYYFEDNSWCPLPDWAKSFLKLGLSLSQFNDDKRRFVVALAVPSRAYAAVLIAGGITCGRSTVTHYETDQEHLNAILSLPNGTPVIYRESGKKYHAIKRDLLTYNDRQYIGIQLDDNQLKKYILPENAGWIEISDKELIKLPKQQKGRDISPPSDLIQNLVGKANISNFIMRTRLETIITGSLITLREEMKLSLSFRQSSTVDCSGSLSDLLRAKECQENGVAFRTSIIPSARKINSKDANEKDPYVVVFDGSQGFLKWRDCWRNFNWIIILDRTEPIFEHSVEHVNQEYLNRSEMPIKLNIPALATGVELMVFGVDK